MTRTLRFFNESVMGFLALVALATALGPLVFDVSPGVERLLTFVEWLLVAAFAAELIVSGANAPDFAAWSRSPWRIVDVVTVLGPVLALLPQISDLASGSLMLRMLRLGRAVMFGTRAGSVAVRQRRRAMDVGRGGHPVVTVLRPDGGSAGRGDWQQFLEWTRASPVGWAHASNLDRDRFVELADAAGLAAQDLNRLLESDGQARLRESAQHTALFLQLPLIPSDDRDREVQRSRLLVIMTDEAVLTAMTGAFDLQTAVTSLTTEFASVPYPARVVCGILSVVRNHNVSIAQRFDAEARRLEALEGGAFLRDTFELRREITTASLDVWHLHSIVRALADGKAKLRGVSLKDHEQVDDLQAETESLNETLNKIKEEVKSLIELSINVKSFEMNAFLKLLAVVSFLGLIPSVAGGLLGMNVLGNPWPVTLGQVSFGVAMGMAVVLYVFAVRGWLR